MESVLVNDDELDDLINSLTSEELKELESIDPDDQDLPASLRCPYKCEKPVTGEFDRLAVLSWIQRKALESPDIEDVVPFKAGVIRGKKYKKEVKKSSESQKNQVEDQFVLASICEPFPNDISAEEMTALADILGVSFQDNCHASSLKVFSEERPNSGNIEDIILKIKQNSPNLIEINLNNIKGIKTETWFRLFTALGENSHVQLVTATNCDISDVVADFICTSLQKNSCLKVLTLDSNLISGEMVLKLIKATIPMKCLEELRVSHQQNCKFLGNRIEEKIGNILAQAPQLIKLGLTMQYMNSINKCAIQLQENLDKRRRNENQ